jgi:hypothetical protein
MIRTLKSLVLAAMLAIPMAAMSGCSQEVSHSESDKPGWFGGQTHKEETVTKNPDGTTSVKTEKQTTSTP